MFSTVQPLVSLHQTATFQKSYTLTNTTNLEGFHNDKYIVADYNRTAKKTEWHIYDSRTNASLFSGEISESFAEVSVDLGYQYRTEEYKVYYINHETFGL